MNGMQEIALDETIFEPGRTLIWKAKDADYSVTVIGDLGVGADGRRYVSVENTSVGIPVDELEISEAPNFIK